MTTDVQNHPRDFAKFEEFMKFVGGGWVFQAMIAAEKLGVADHLTSGPKHVSELADLCQCDESYLYRTMRYLASAGIFVEDDQKFSQNPMSEYLASCLRPP